MSDNKKEKIIESIKPSLIPIKKNNSKLLLKAKLSDFRNSYKNLLVFKQVKKNIFLGINEENFISILLRKDVNSDYLQAASCSLFYDLPNIYNGMIKRSRDGKDFNNFIKFINISDLFFKSLFSESEFETVRRWSMFSIQEVIDKKLKYKKYETISGDTKIVLNVFPNNEKFINITIVPYKNKHN